MPLLSQVIPIINTPDGVSSKSSSKLEFGKLIRPSHLRINLQGYYQQGSENDELQLAEHKPPGRPGSGPGPGNIANCHAMNLHSTWMAQWHCHRGTDVTELCVLGVSGKEDSKLSITYHWSPDFLCRKRPARWWEGRRTQHSRWRNRAKRWLMIFFQQSSTIYIDVDLLRTVELIPFPCFLKHGRCYRKMYHETRPSALSPLNSSEEQLTVFCFCCHFPGEGTGTGRSRRCEDQRWSSQVKSSSAAATPLIIVFPLPFASLPAGLEFFWLIEFWWFYIFS